MQTQTAAGSYMDPACGLRDKLSQLLRTGDYIGLPA
jgi:hypothetical protein